MHVTIAFHYSRPEYVNDFLRYLNKVTEHMRKAPGLINIEGFKEVGSDRLVAVGVWESATAFDEALPELISLNHLRRPEWTIRPDELIRLEQPK
jgi:quinol monooxygenase YgiN